MKNVQKRAVVSKNRQNLKIIFFSSGIRQNFSLKFARIILFFGKNRQNYFSA
jgi:hypothetical protein